MSHLEREIYDLQNELKQAHSRHGELTRERDRYRVALRGSVIQDAGGISLAPSQQAQQASSSHSVPLNSVIVMSGGSLRGLRRQDSADDADKPQKKRKRGND